MKNDTTLAGLVEQWPELKKRTEEETDPDKLIAAAPPASPMTWSSPPSRSSRSVRSGG